MASSNLSSYALLCITTLAMLHTLQAKNSPQDFVRAHNRARAEVNVGPVAWNATVAAYAQKFAHERIGDCLLEHSYGPYGECLYWVSGGEFNAADAVEAWVAEKQYYDYESNSCAAGQQCGHYTQVVWADTTSIGCARVRCESGALFIVCSYYPPGNYEGQRPH